MKRIVILMLGMAAEMNSSIAHSQPQEPLCVPSRTFLTTLFSNENDTAVKKILLNAVEEISKNRSVQVTELSKDLLQKQVDLLNHKKIKFVSDPKKRWIDITADPNGSELNRLAFELNHSSENKRLLRYYPEQLLRDAEQYKDQLIAHRQRPLYLSHLDVLTTKPESLYLKEQRSLARATDQALGKIDQLPNPLKKTITRADHTKDFLNERAFPPYSNPDRIKELVHRYFEKSPDLVLIKNEADPIVVKIGPAKRMARESSIPIRDVSGVEKSIYSYEDFHVSELAGPIDQSSSIYDLFLQDAYFNRPNGLAPKFRRALVTQDGRTLAHLSGTHDIKSYLDSYLDFLDTIYTHPKGLNLSKDTFARLKNQSLELADRSELIVRTQNKTWLKTKDAKEVSGGLIIVKSENPRQMLPMREAHPELKFDQPENEIWVEAGRLGSLTSEETIQFLKIAGTSLHAQYPNRVVRILCEGNRSRAKLFSKFGFVEAPIKISDKAYYPDGTDLVLHVTLDQFMEKVLAR